MQVRQKKLLPWMIILGIVACVSILWEIVVLVDLDIYLLIPRELEKSIFIVPIAASSMYLLFSALVHFHTGKAVGLWFGILVPVVCEVGALLLLVFIDFKGGNIPDMTPPYIIAGYPFPIPILALALAVVAIVKKDVRFGWGTAALLFGFWLGFMVAFMADGGLDDVIEYCWWQFVGIGVFIIVDLCCIIRPVRRERIAAAT